MFCVGNDDNRQDESRHSKIYSTKHLVPAFVIGAFGSLSFFFLVFRNAKENMKFGGRIENVL